MNCAKNNNICLVVFLLPHSAAVLYGRPNRQHHRFLVVLDLFRKFRTGL